ncbi:Trafficking protein particle complex 8 [Dinochytrium kinnereticum]|nr:Trafficking protein particle complex 8 [Dinochytrium kinnereticum]
MEGIGTDLRRVLLETMKNATPLNKMEEFCEESMKGVGIEELTPWYTDYRNYICKYVGAMEHETFDHPVACLLVASTANVDPIEALSKLYPDDLSKVPAVFQKGLMDAQISLKHYLLIHDTSKSGNVEYNYNSPELIMRKLADYSFMLRDYRFAYSVYESVRKDFQGNDKALKHYAGSQEMLALCLIMSESNIRGSLDTLLESAIGHYLDANTAVLATRITMFVYEIFKYRSQYREIPNILLRMIGDDSDLRSALLLEQAAFCYAKSSPPMLRKFAFYTILASYRFNKCSQPAHAFRCYNIALDLYKNKKWTLIEDHIQFSLGKLSAQLERPADAITHFASLLHSSQQPPHIQQAYINEFLSIYKSRRPMHVATEDEVWDSMEKDLADEMSMTTGTKSTSKGLKNLKDGGKSVCAVGEPVFLELEMENPLQVTLQLSDLYLFAEFHEDSSSGSSTSIQTSVDVDRLVFENFDMECLTTLALDPLEKRLVFPKKEGEIRIKGLRYMLFGVVPNYMTFDKRGVRLNLTSDQRLNPTYAEDNTLNLVITAPLPILDVVFHSFPEALLSGQVERTVLEINNKGNRGLKNLMVKLSHPSFFSIGTPDQIDHATYQKEEGPNSSVYNFCSMPNEIFNSSVNTIKLPVTSTGNGEELLEPGMTTIIPISVRGDRIGKHIFRFLFMYKSEDKNDQISYRKLQYTLTMQVYPSLRINAFTRPSTRALNEFILGVEIENLQQSAPMKLRQITAIGSSWRITAMNGSSVDAQPSYLTGKQTSFAYFRFKRLPATESDYLSEIATTSAIKSFIYGDDKAEFKPNALTLQASSVSLNGEGLDCKSTTLKNLSLNSRVQWRKHALQSHYPGLSPEKLKSLFTLYYTDDIDIALFWEAPPSGSSTVSRLGHHYIIGINLGLQSPLQLHSRFSKSANAILANNKSLYAATIREKKELLNSLLRPKQKDVSPVRILLSSHDSYTHNFSSGNLQIPISSKLHNTSWNNTVSYLLDMQSPDVKSTQEDMFLDYYWSGPVQAHGVLGPGQELELNFFANFTRGGTFDLNRWKLSIFVLETDDSKGNVGKHASLGADYSSGSYVQYPSVQHLVNIFSSE